MGGFLKPVPRETEGLNRGSFAWGLLLHRLAWSSLLNLPETIPTPSPRFWERGWGEGNRYVPGLCFWFSTTFVSEPSPGFLQDQLPHSQPLSLKSEGEGSERGCGADLAMTIEPRPWPANA